MPGSGLSSPGSVAPLTDTLTSIPSSPSSPLFAELSAPPGLWLEGIEGDDAVSLPPDSPEELEDLLDDELLEEEDELLELGMDGIEGLEEDDELGIDGVEEEDDDELGIEGIDDEDDDGEELGIDGMEEELLELCWVDSQPASTKPRVTAVARALSEGKGLRMLRSSTIASMKRSG
jgi:hypothetical protein